MEIEAKDDSLQSSSKRDSCDSFRHGLDFEAARGRGLRHSRFAGTRFGDSDMPNGTNALIEDIVALRSTAKTEDEITSWFSLNLDRLTTVFFGDLDGIIQPKVDSATLHLYIESPPILLQRYGIEDGRVFEARFFFRQTEKCCARHRACLKAALTALGLRPSSRGKTRPPSIHSGIWLYEHSGGLAWNEWPALAETYSQRIVHDESFVHAQDPYGAAESWRRSLRLWAERVRAENPA